VGCAAQQGRRAGFPGNRGSVPHASQLAVLGKTGFISKEDVPDMPGGQMMKACLEAFKTK